MTTFTVSQLAAQVGTTADTLRYYERIGLLPAPQRTPSGYRQYVDDDLERVRFIKRAQRFGLRLDDIGALLRIREQGACPCGHSRTLLEQRLEGVDEELAQLTHLRGDITRMLVELEPGGSGWTSDGTTVPQPATPTERPLQMTDATTCQCGADDPTRTTGVEGCQCGCNDTTAPSEDAGGAKAGCQCGCSDAAADTSTGACQCGCSDA